MQWRAAGIVYWQALQRVADSKDLAYALSAFLDALISTLVSMQTKQMLNKFISYQSCIRPWETAYGVHNGQCDELLRSDTSHHLPRFLSCIDNCLSLNAVEINSNIYKKYIPPIWG